MRSGYAQNLGSRLTEIKPALWDFGDEHRLLTFSFEMLCPIIPMMGILTNYKDV